MMQVMASMGLIGRFAVLGAACVAVAACAGGPQLPSLSTASLPKIGIGETGVVAAGSAEVYSRIAQGANRCWFGGVGRLKGSHILHADADSPQKGGAVDIIVHERAVDQPKIWGYKAYRISVTEVGGQSFVNVENLRMPEIEESRMRAEVLRWADGGDACEVPPVAAAVPEAVPASPAPVARQKPASKGK